MTSLLAGTVAHGSRGGRGVSTSHCCCIFPGLSGNPRYYQCSPMAVGLSDISGNDWLGPINSSPAADCMSDEIFGANLVFLAEI